MDSNYNESIENKKRESTDRFPCPSCGGNMTFDPESQSLLCPYCKNSIDISNSEGEIQEYDLESAEIDAPKDWGKEKRVIRCESCGAETVLDENAVAQFCAFCGSSHIVKNEESPGIVPESLIPFKVSREVALQQFKKWISKRFFAPNALKNEYQNQKLSGIYVPCWTYDSETYSTYTAQAGTYYYVTENHWVEENGKRRMVTRQVRKIRWRFVSGTHEEFFNDVLVNASKKVDESLMSKLEPFHLKELVHYKPEFLSGFLAERYSIGLKEGWDRAKNIIRDHIRSNVTSKIGADEVRNLCVNTMHSNVKYKHILLPIWMSAYTYRGKLYRYMVNGETGEVQGKAPVSPVKVTAVILGVIAIIALIAFIASNM